MKLSVVIINYKTANLTVDCLTSFLGEMEGIDGRVMIVDNNSGDGSVDVLRTWLKEHDKNNIVTLIESPTNSGFSGGNNLGICAAEAEYYLLLNSDTIVHKDAIKILLQTAEDYPEAGLVSPRLEWPDATPQESCFRYHTPIAELIGAAATGPLTKLFKGHVVALEVSDMEVRPQWTSFACVLIRAQVFKDVGLLDDGFFMYYEDAELCYRARQAGWQIVHTPYAHVVHLRGGSSLVKSRMAAKKRLPRYYYASRSRFYYLLYGRTGLTLANVLWGVGVVLRKLRDVIERRESSLPDKKWLDIWTNWWHPGGDTERADVKQFKGHS